ncbi:MAG: hypothetical protein QNJ04_08800, partial [Desulfobacterales bacterium]|nr:hypothetical protein [Desulfobacterales bacterium]
MRRERRRGAEDAVCHPALTGMHLKMEWIEAKIEFDIKADAAAEELIADVFYAFGVRGVVVEDPETEVPPDALMDEEVRPPVNSVSGYFPAKTFDQARRRAFEQAVE